jgi:glyoxylate/hydroxypyruvate reductase
MKILEEAPFELILNPDNAEPSREWVLKHLADPEVHGACIMHSQSSDKVDKEFLDACNPNIKVISTFSVGYGKSSGQTRTNIRSH